MVVAADIRGRKELFEECSVGEKSYRGYGLKKHIYLNQGLVGHTDIAIRYSGMKG